MPANDTMGHGRPKSGPTRPAVAIVFHAIKRSKGLGTLRLWNSGAVIAHRQENERGACLLHLLQMNMHRRIGVGIADRIADDVLNPVSPRCACGQSSRSCAQYVLLHVIESGGG
jgi:hypothetical protein